MNPAQEEIAKLTNRDKIQGTLPDIISGADVFIGVSGPGALTGELVRMMNQDAIVLAMANPTPEIFP
ncbi:hypothetical protein GCM10020331_037080 [Ectobacillus funiculus]